MGWLPLCRRAEDKNRCAGTEILMGRNLLSGSVVAVFEEISFELGDVLSCWNSSTTGGGPSTMASTPPLRMPPGGGLESRPFRHRLRCPAQRDVPFVASQLVKKGRGLKIALQILNQIKCPFFHLRASAFICGYSPFFWAPQRLGGKKLAGIK